MIRFRARPGIDNITRKGGGGSGPVSPTPPPGMLAWYDFSDLSTITTSGNNPGGGQYISQINDKSGNGHNATQGTQANQPTINFRTLNGLPSAYFDGADWLNLPSSLYNQIGGGTVTMYVVCANDLTSGEQKVLTFGNTADRIFIANNSTNEMRVIHQGTGFTPPTVTITRDTATHTFTLRRNGTTQTARYDNASVSNTSANNFTSTNGAIGANGVSGGQPWTGLISSILIYPEDTIANG